MYKNVFRFYVKLLSALFNLEQSKINMGDFQ